MIWIVSTWICVALRFDHPSSCEDKALLEDAYQIQEESRMEEENAQGTVALGPGNPLPTFPFRTPMNFPDLTMRSSHRSQNGDYRHHDCHSN